MTMAILANEKPHEELFYEIYNIIQREGARVYSTGFHEDIICVNPECRYINHHPTWHFRNFNLNHSPIEKTMGQVFADMGVIPKDGRKFLIDVKQSRNVIEALPILEMRHRAVRKRGNCLFITQLHGFWSGNEPQIERMLIPKLTSFDTEMCEGMIEEAGEVFGISENSINRKYICKCLSGGNCGGSHDPFFILNMNGVPDGRELLRQRLRL